MMLPRITGEGGRPALSVHALITCVAMVILLVACAARTCLSNRRRRRRIPFIFQDSEEVKKNPGRLSSTVARAAASGDTAQIRQWIEVAGKGGLDARTSQGRTALHYAATEGHGSIMHLLLDAGCDVHALDNASQTALHIVSAQGHGTCVKMMLDRGADPTATDSANDSPLSLAERGGRVGTVRLMRLHLSQGRSLYGGAGSGNGGPVSSPDARHR
ncbi:ankyrin repeat-containing domain protein [Pavlovales sp. CCMP2436]|nr:ankyrin repeat-containing domain protein [Pavlovales sp. CCMP2436]